MPEAEGLSAVQQTFIPTTGSPVDEAAWHAWIQKGLARDRMQSARNLRLVKLGSLASLLLAAALWEHIPPYAVFLRFLVAGGAIVLMIQASYSGRIIPAVIFGALVVLYNPVFPVFSMSGTWQLVLVAASTLPFVASLNLWEKTALQEKVPLARN